VPNLAQVRLNRQLPAQGGFSSPVTLRRRRQAHRLDVWHRDLIQDLGELLIGSL
jgi:hypothetical protein